MSDVAWKMGETWVLLTERSPAQMEGKQPMCVYYPLSGPRRFQYKMDRKPRGLETTGLSFLRD